MIQTALMEYCAPTLAGIKTGNLFSLKSNSPEINQEIRNLNRILTRRGLRLIPIRRTGKRTLVYLYRPDRLMRDLLDPTAAEILREKGYSCKNPDSCVVELVRHLQADEDFPHEIGLFLSYPPADVKAFIKSPCEGVKCCGCWKAYGNEREAQKTFELYQKCTAIYCRECRKGTPLESLIFDAENDLRFAI